MLCHVLAEEGERVWLAFRKPVAESNGASLRTHYVICSQCQAILVDPGGQADFGPLLAAVSEKIDLAKITAIVLTQPLASAIAAIDMWADVVGEGTPVFASEMMASDLLHLSDSLNIQTVAERGGEIAMSDGSGLHMISAPYLPTAASMTLYDPVARVLYTGDIGTAEGQWSSDSSPFCERFSMIGHAMTAFHQAWFASSSARDEWRDRVGSLAIDVIAPRAGPCLK